MRKAVLCALMTALPLLLCSCSAGDGGPEQDVQAIQENFAAAENVSFDGKLTADYGNRVYDFVVSFTGLPKDGVITIKEPESISGTQVVLSDGSALLKSGEAQVYTGEILPDGLSPMDAVPVMVEAWRGGLVTEAVYESFDGIDCVSAVFRLTDDTSMRVWFSLESGLPLFTEIDFQGYTVISCEFYNVSAE